MNEALALEGRAAIVTGAGNGLGRAEARALARAGARIVLNDLPGESVQTVADEIRADGGQAVVCPGDVSEWQTGQKLVSAALDAFGRLDVLVNNAGVLRDRMVFTMSAEEWDLVIRVHLRGHFVTTPFRHGVLAGAEQAGGRAGLRQDREHLLRGVPARLPGTAQLRRGQGRDRRTDGRHRAQLRPLRRAGQRHLPAGAHQHDR
jgi:NAD(P)-dependent dehydrogenase (short-subunit alcohol dehydrogenase family)